VLAASIIRAMLEAASISETLVNFYLYTRRNNPKNSHLQFLLDLIIIKIIYYHLYDYWLVHGLFDGITANIINLVQKP
jgi:hypothetical protein